MSNAVNYTGLGIALARAPEKTDGFDDGFSACSGEPLFSSPPYQQAVAAAEQALDSDDDPEMPRVGASGIEAQELLDSLKDQVFKRMRKYQQRIRELNKRIEELEAAEEGYNDAITLQDEDIIMMRDQEKLLEQENKKKDAVIDDQRQKLEFQEKAIAALQQRNDALCSMLERERADKGAVIDGQRQKLGFQEKAIVALQQRNDFLYSTLERERADRETETASLKAQLAEKEKLLRSGSKRRAGSVGDEPKAKRTKREERKSIRVPLTVRVVDDRDFSSGMGR